MRERSPEKGAALIMLLGIIATLAIMAVMLVTVLANQQAATAQQRDRVVSENYAEGAVDAVVQAAKAASPLPTVSPTASGGGWLSVAELSTITSGLGYPPGTQIEYWIYDNQATVNRAINWDKGSPAASSTPDGMVWVEILATTAQGQKSRVRVLVRSGTASIVSGLPRAVVYSDTGITLLDTSNLYAVKDDGTAITTSGSKTWVMTGTYFTANGTATLRGPGSSVQGVGIRSNGTITPAGKFSDAVSAANSVGLLSDYFDQSEQAALADESQAAANMSLYNTTVTMYSSLNSLQNAMTRTGTSPNYTYTANADMGYSGNLTLGSSGTTTRLTYKFNKLYVSGNLTIRNNTTVNTTALRVGTPGETTAHGIVISGATDAIVDHFGPVFATGDCVWSGTTSVQTTNYKLANATATAILPPDPIDPPTVNPPGPMWVRRLQITASAGSVYAFGDVWVNGFDDTNNSTKFAGPSSGTAVQVWCPLLATTEQTTSSGLVNFGSRARPMTYYMQCDNDGGYVNTCDWASQGTFYGLMVLMEARVEFSGSSTRPSVEGAVFVGTPAPTPPSNFTQPSGRSDIPDGDDITLAGASTIAYNQAVIDACINKSITTTTQTVQMVPGSWQQLSAN